VTVTSPIVRLGDVVRPLDPNMGGWQRLRRSPIGLVPLGGQTMSIERHRLAQAIHDAEATPLAIDWVGPTKIQVIFRAADPAAPKAQSKITQNITQVAYKDDVNAPLPTAKTAPISSSEAERILHWIKLALDREQSSIAERYRIEIDRRQSALEKLRSISGVTSIEPRDPIGEGTCRFHVVGRSVEGPAESLVAVELIAHPLVVVSRRSLARGHRIGPGDLAIKPFPEDNVEADFLLDPEAAIGLEVRGSVRANRPIPRLALGAPTLIHRGDLIEVRVAAGGITVTTNAKALSDGAQSDLIEIETLQPRKRLVARVVEPGMVEIFTRAPRVRP
jgi:flagella basal body P-ring formation protein FlgA